MTRPWLANCRNPEGDYGAVANLLLDAGAKIPPEFQPTPAMQALLRRRGPGAA